MRSPALFLLVLLMLLFVLAGSQPAVGMLQGGATEDAYTERALLSSPAPGRHTGKGTARPVSSRAPQVLAVFHLHYNDKTGGGFRREDGSDVAALHPSPRKGGYAYSRPGWSAEELDRLNRAGFDTALIAWWSGPSELRDPLGTRRWSFDGLKSLVAAAEARRAKGRPTPSLAIRLEGGILDGHNAIGRKVDVSTPDGRAWLYVTLRDFFSLVPPALRTTINGRPLVVLTALPGGAFPASVLDYVRLRFAEDFVGQEPYILSQAPGQFPNADGISIPLGVNLGYGDAALLDTANAKAYERNWTNLLAYRPERRPHLVIVDSWNNWQQGTAVASSREHGTRSVDLTRRYASLLRTGKSHPIPGPFTNSAAVSVTFTDKDPLGRGVSIVPWGDGEFVFSTAGGTSCIETVIRPEISTYVYFDVNDSFFFDSPGEIEVLVEYFDEGTVPFSLQYDSADPTAMYHGAYKIQGGIKRGNTLTWKTHRFRLKDPRFVNRQNGGADFRLETFRATYPLKVRMVAVRKVAAGG